MSVAGHSLLFGFARPPARFTIAKNRNRLYIAFCPVRNLEETWRHIEMLSQVA